MITVAFARNATAPRTATQTWTMMKSPTTAHIGGAAVAASRRRMCLVRNKLDGIPTIKIHTTNLHKDHKVRISSVQSGRETTAMEATINAKDFNMHLKRSQESLQEPVNEPSGRETTAEVCPVSCVQQIHSATKAGTWNWMELLRRRYFSFSWTTHRWLNVVMVSYFLDA